MTLTEKSIKSILREQLNEQQEEYQRFLGVVAEEFQSQVKLVAESLSGTQEQLIAIRDMVAKNTEDIEIIKNDLHLIKDDFKERIDRKEFKALEHRLAILERKFVKPHRILRS